MRINDDTDILIVVFFSLGILAFVAAGALGTAVGLLLAPSLWAPRPFLVLDTPVPAPISMVAPTMPVALPVVVVPPDTPTSTPTWTPISTPTWTPEPPTPMPTATVFNTATPIPPPPTPIPPTALPPPTWTPVPPPTWTPVQELPTVAPNSAAVAYLNELEPPLTYMSKALIQIGILAQSPNFNDQNWIVSLGTYMGIVKAGHEKIASLNPPPILAAMHQTLVAGTQKASDAMDKFAFGIDNKDPAAVLDAVRLMMEGTTLINSANEQMMTAAGLRP